MNALTCGGFMRVLMQEGGLPEAVRTKNVSARATSLRIWSTKRLRTHRKEHTSPIRHRLGVGDLDALGSILEARPSE